MEETPYINQSEFYQDVTGKQAPPDTITAATKPTKPVVGSVKKPQFIVIVGLGFFTIILILLVLISRPPAPVPITIPPTPTQTIQKEPSELEKQLEVVNNQVLEANPRAPILEPPPVDMKVKF